jgi:hypothetical protein
MILYPQEPEARALLTELALFRPILKLEGVTAPALRDLHGEIQDAIRRLETLARNIDNEVFDRQIEPEALGA